jgi:hypothetical protein
VILPATCGGDSSLVSWAGRGSSTRLSASPVRGVPGWRRGPRRHRRKLEMVACDVGRRCGRGPLRGGGRSPLRRGGVRRHGPARHGSAIPGAKGDRRRTPSRPLRRSEHQKCRAYVAFPWHAGETGRTRSWPSGPDWLFEAVCQVHEMDDRTRAAKTAYRSCATGSRCHQDRRRLPAWRADRGAVTVTVSAQALPGWLWRWLSRRRIASLRSGP